MSMIDTVIQEIGRTKVISILRGIEAQTAQPVAVALKAGGVTCIEVTMNTPSSLQIIESLKDLEGMFVGAGTVLDVSMAKQSIDAGAKFVLSPNLDVEVIEYCLEHDVLPIPGVFSPTEIYIAHKAGAPLLKIFPVGSVGPQYIKDLLGPFKGMRYIPVGGVSVENTAAFMKAGSYAVGIGSALVSPELARSGDWKSITMRAQQFIEQAHSL